MLGRFLLKTNQGKSTTHAFKKLISKRKLDKIWSDRGREFRENAFLLFLKEQITQVYSTKFC